MHGASALHLGTCRCADNTCRCADKVPRWRSTFSSHFCRKIQLLCRINLRKPTMPYGISKCRLWHWCLIGSASDPPWHQNSFEETWLLLVSKIALSDQHNKIGLERAPPSWSHAQAHSTRETKEICHIVVSVPRLHLASRNNTLQCFVGCQTTRMTK